LSDCRVEGSVPWKFLGNCYLPLVCLSIIFFSQMKLPEYFTTWSLALTAFKKYTCNLAVKGTWVQKGSLYQLPLIAPACSATSHDVSTGCEWSGPTTNFAVSM